MAIQNAQARLYNAFQARVVDKSGSAELVSEFKMGHQDLDNPEIIIDDVQITRVLRNKFEFMNSTSSLSAQGKLLIKGGVVNATSRSRLTAAFPTFIRIDIDALELPEGRDVTLQLEEGFVIEDTNKFPFSLGNPNAANNNWVTFRVPYKVNAFTSSLFTANFIPLRIKQSSSSSSSVSSLSALPIFNPGKLAAMFGGNFITTTNPIKTAVLGLHIDAISNLINIPLRIKAFESNFQTSEATLVNIGNIARLFNIELNSEFTQPPTDFIIGKLRVGDAVLDSNFDLFNESRLIKDNNINATSINTLQTMTSVQYVSASNINSVFSKSIQASKRVNILSSINTSSSVSSTANNVSIIRGTGSNFLGQLGLDDTTLRSTPTRITPVNWSQISSGSTHSLAIKENGELWAWGNNTDGRTGLGLTSGSTNTPTRVGTASNWVQVSAGANYSLAINSLGQLFAWGRNNVSQLGLGDTTNRSTPTRVGIASNWAQVSAGIFASFAITTTGQLWAWGNNTDGRTGLGLTSGSTNTPTRVGFASNWVQVTRENSHTLAINSLGQLFAWGRNNVSQLGLGDTTNRSTPTRVGIASNWAQVSAGNEFSTAITTTGQLWAWGTNIRGSTGLGLTSGSTNTPTRVGSASNWAQISASGGGGSSSAITTTGELFAWGDNGGGALGLGNLTIVSSPTQVGTRNYWLKVSSSLGGNHTLTIMKFN